MDGCLDESILLYIWPGFLWLIKDLGGYSIDSIA